MRLKIVNACLRQTNKVSKQIFVGAIWGVRVPPLELEIGTKGLAMARYGLIFCQNEAYHFQEAF